MKVYVMVYQNDRCEWDAEVDVFTTKEEAQRVMREQYQAAFRRRGCINGYVADPMDGSLPAKRYSCRDDIYLPVCKQVDNPLSERRSFRDILRSGTDT